MIVEEFVAPGDANFEYRDFAFLGEGSVLAAEAARCAGDQGQFWTYHDYLFANQPQSHGDGTGYSRETIDAIAEEIGLDMEQFTTCMDEGTYQDDVIQAREEASDRGVQGTPTILINGEIVQGIETYDDLLQRIQEAIQESGQ